MTSWVVAGLVTALVKPVVGATGRQIAGATVPALLSALAGFAVVAPLEHVVMHSDSRGVALGLLLLTVDGVVFLAVFGTALWVISPSTLKDLFATARGLLSKWRAGRVRPRQLDAGALVGAPTEESQAADSM